MTLDWTSLGLLLAVAVGLLAGLLLAARRAREAERRRADLAVRLAQWRAQALHAELWLDAAGRTRMRSDAPTAQLGGTPAEWDDAGADALRRRVHPEDRALLDAALAAGPAAPPENPQIARYRLQRARGGYGWFIHQGRAARDAAGRPDGQWITLRDITAEQLMEERLQRSQRYFQQLVDSMPWPVLVFDASGNIVFVNRAGDVWFGGSADSLLGGTLAAVLPPDEARRQAELVARVLAERGVQTGEERLTLNGAARTALATRTHFASDRGDLVIAVWSDITARQQMEEELRKLSRAVEQCPVSIVITDPAGAIQYVNPRFCQVTGYAAAEALGRNPRILKSGFHDEFFYRHLWETLRRGEEWRGEMQNRRKNGDLFWESVTISPLLDGAGEVAAYIAVKEDITARKASLEALRRSEERFKLAAQIAGLGIWDWDIWANRLEWDRQMYALHGLPADAPVTAAEWERRVAPEQRGDFRRLVNGRPGDASSALEVTITRADGAVRRLQLQAQALGDEQGRRRRILGAAQDVTEQRDVARRMQTMLDEMERANRLMSGRESRVVALKNQVNQLCRELQRPPAYPWTAARMDEMQTEKSSA